ncbi:MAG: YkgJ family cysteine cluster protein [Methanobacterium paludis]|nr:YkgJ family cysteine cluster protein [Methanobacterium paludis]
MEGKCNMCGSCCKAIRVSISPEKLEKEVKELYPDGVSDDMPEVNDYGFMKLYWKSITRKEALKRNPHIKTWGERDYDYFYECIWFKNNHCSCHDRKPHICSEYPWYGEKPSDIHLYSPNCGYKIDIKEAAK